MKRLESVPDVEHGERGPHPAALRKNLLLQVLRPPLSDVPAAKGVGMFLGRATRNVLHILLAETRQKCPFLHFLGRSL